MSIEHDESVAIFWDYENCELPGSADAFSVTGGIRRIAHEYGTVTTFRAYFEMSDQSSPRSLATRSDLQSCGVSLVDCPHNGRKDVADKMMIVDMLTYAMDSSSPNTIILISGDRDFLYAVSILRLRKFRVVLMTPSNVHSGLKAQASATYEWPRQILQADAMTALGQPPTRHEKSSSLISARIGLPTPPAPKDNLPATPAQVVAPPLPPSPQAPTYSRAGAPMAGPLGARARSSSTPHARPSPLAIVEPVLSTSASQVSASMPPARKSLADIVGFAGVPGQFTQIDTQVSRGNENNSAVAARAMAVAALEKVGIVSSTPGTDVAAASTALTEPSESTEERELDTTGEANISILSSGSQAENEHNREDTNVIANFAPVTPGLPQLDLSPTSQVAGYYDSAEALAGAAGQTPVETSSVADYTPDPEGTPAFHVHPDVVIPSVVMVRLRKPPTKYKLLVRVLERERLQGNTRVVFSQLGSMLRAEHPSVYQRAGANQLKDYIAMAEKDVIVIVGRNDWENGNRWVALHPAYHGKPPEAVPSPAPLQEPVA